LQFLGSATRLTPGMRGAAAATARRTVSYITASKAAEGNLTNAPDTPRHNGILGCVMMRYVTGPPEALPLTKRDTLIPHWGWA